MDRHPPAVTLRPAEPRDARAMAEMSRDLIEAGLEWRYTPHRIAALIGDAETVALVACDGGQILGFAIMEFGDTTAHLTLLCVQRARHRRRIATRLVEWLFGSARVAGIESIGVELRADNAAARSFYLGLGFTETRWVPGYYDGRIAARRMALQLRAR